ncbi:MAG: hypothetical protein IPO87_14005 [Flavobacteriales bacterium]|nr:hypothetical protein [Flavobacteriales bacterium]
MRRIAPLMVLSLCCGLVHAQPGWAPLSREVERPYATQVQAYGSAIHSAIRPYRAQDLRISLGADSLLPKAAIKKLDSWAGRMNGRKFRWGPMLEANGGYGMGSNSETIYRGSAGFWADLDAGSRLNFHLDGQGWGEQLPSYLDTVTSATQVTPGEGYAYGTTSTVTHYDWNGHISWDAHKFINLTLGKGKNTFGNGYRSLFLSSEAYSYPYLKITTSVWNIKYINLFTVMNDIRGAAGDPGKYGTKYTSMHYLSWNVSKRINLAAFESIVWSQGDSLYPRGFDITYLNPVIFYRPNEFQIGSPDNALLGLSINVKVGKHILFYSQLMLDEFLLDQIRNGYGWYANKQALQLGMNMHEAFGVKGLQVRAEYNVVRPFMYTHSDTRQNYAHMGQPLAHPYGSNFQEGLVNVDLVRDRWVFSVKGNMAWLGEDSVFSYGANIFRPERDRPVKENGQLQDYGYRIGQYKLATVAQAEFRVGWTLDPRSAMRLELGYLFRTYDAATASVTTDHIIKAGLMCYFRERHAEQVPRYVLN